MVTTVEVVDTAIKIGLGALISGAAAYLVAKLNHDRTVEKERAQRRRELFETIAEQVGAFDQAALNHWAFAINWIIYTPQERQMTEEECAELARLKAELLASFRELKSAGAKLLLLGETKCHELLREYGVSTLIVRADILAKREITVDELNTYKKEFKSKLEAFFTELSNAYKKL